MDWQAVKHEYETTNLSLKEIAEKFGCKPSTLRSHKSREKWQRNTKPKSATQHATRKKSAATRPKSAATKTAVEKVEQADLNDKQKAFALNYLKYHNATQSYIDAYGTDYNTASQLGWRLLRNVKVRKLLDELRKEQESEMYLTANDIIIQYAKQAFADIGLYLNFGNKDELDPDTGEQYKRSYVYFKDKDSVDTSLISEVHIGQNGAVLKLYDKQKAMEKLLEYLPEPTNDDQTKDSFLEAIKQAAKQMQEKDDES
ncbi:terminase small subunit [Lentilactobacillus buchneri]|uniref:terminase small subunit n=1 Tax=Lentilactobacillus buchneri TaxID=1581 RepID=UPI0021A4A963|nr:terminase small subunit [Lentilactobacillus buchneri]MCT2881935.1 terminase [Lentilactobacillus buchneri]